MFVICVYDPHELASWQASPGLATRRDSVGGSDCEASTPSSSSPCSQRNVQKHNEDDLTASGFPHAVVAAQNVIFFFNWKIF